MARREKTRGYVWKPSDASAVDGTDGDLNSSKPASTITSGGRKTSLMDKKTHNISDLTRLGEKARRRCFCALLVLQDTSPTLLQVRLSLRVLFGLPDNEYAQDLEEALVKSFFHSVHLLLRASLSSSLTVSLVQTSLSAIISSTAGVVVSQGSLAAALASFSGNLLSRSEGARIQYLQYGPSNSASLLLSGGNGVCGSTQAVHFFLTVGTSLGQIPALRRLSMHMSSILLPYIMPNSSNVDRPGLVSSSGLRSQVSNQLMSHVQQLSQLRHTDAGLDAAFVLLPLITALSQYRAGPSCFDQGSVKGQEHPFSTFSDLFVKLNEIVSQRCCLFRGLTALILTQLQSQRISSIMPNQIRDGQSAHLTTGSSGGYSLQKLYSHKAILHILLLSCLEQKEKRLKEDDEEAINHVLAECCLKAMMCSSEKLKSQINHMYREMYGGCPHNDQLNVL